MADSNAIQGRGMRTSLCTDHGITELRLLNLRENRRSIYYCPEDVLPKADSHRSGEVSPRPFPEVTAVLDFRDPLVMRCLDMELQSVIYLDSHKDTE